MASKKEIVLAQLNERENEDLACIFFEECTSFHILFGVISMDLLEDEEKGKKITYDTLTDKIDYTVLDSRLEVNSKEHVQEDELHTLYALLLTWIKKCMRYKNYGEVRDIPSDTRGLQNNADILAFTFMETLCGIAPGHASQKYRNLVKLYEQVEDEFTVENIMRYIVTVIEQTGFSRKEQEGNIGHIDVSEITFEEYTNFTNRTPIDVFDYILGSNILNQQEQEWLIQSDRNEQNFEELFKMLNNKQ